MHCKCEYGQLLATLWTQDTLLYFCTPFGPHHPVCAPANKAAYHFTDNTGAVLSDVLRSTEAKASRHQTGIRRRDDEKRYVAQQGMAFELRSNSGGALIVDKSACEVDRWDWSVCNRDGARHAVAERDAYVKTVA